MNTKTAQNHLSPHLCRQLAVDFTESAKQMLAMKRRATTPHERRKWRADLRSVAGWREYAIALATGYTDL
jgi:hypothetical protein